MPKDANKTEAEVFAEAVTNAEIRGTPLYTRLYLLFADEMHKAVDQGRICTPERMAALYPIFREINEETDSTATHWQQIELRAKQRKARRLASEVRNA